MEILATILIPAIIVIAILAIAMAGYVKAPADKAYIITGPRKKKVLIGKAGIKIPFLERMDKLDLSLIPVDVRTQNAVPTADFINVKVNSNVNIRIGQTDELLARAATHFLNIPGENIGVIARETLEASVREIIGTMRLQDMVSDRQKFSEAVLDTAVPDLAKMGLEIISFNVQDFADGNGVIENLGVDNVEKIRKAAQIARAEAEAEVAISKAENAKKANDAKAAAQEAIAERNAQLDRKQADLKREVDTQKAQADAALSIEAENQRKLRDVAATDANIAKAEREADLKQKEIKLKEYELDALVRKQADAEKYAAEQKAEAEKATRQRKAEAEAYQAVQEAKAKKETAELEAEAEKARAEAALFAAKAEAEGIQAKLMAEAEGIKAKGLAEAEGIEKKAEAQKKMGEASVLEMYFAALPEIAGRVAAPLENCNGITIYGEGGTQKMIGDVTQSMDGIIKAVTDSTGIDLKSVLAGLVASKALNGKNPE